MTSSILVPHTPAGGEFTVLGGISVLKTGRSDGQPSGGTRGHRSTLIGPEADLTAGISIGANAAS